MILFNFAQKKKSIYMKKINYLNAVSDMSAVDFSIIHIKGSCPDLLEKHKVDDLTVRVVTQGLDSRFYVMPTKVYKRGKKSMFQNFDAYPIEASEAIEIVCMANINEKLVYTFNGESLHQSFKKVIDELIEVNEAAYYIIDKHSSVKWDDKETVLKAMREAVYSADFFKARIEGEKITKGVYAGTMVMVCAQIIVDNCDYLIDKKLLRGNVKFLASKLISELLILVDMNLKNSGEMESFDQLKGWFEQQFEATFKAAALDEGKRKFFYESWDKVLGELGIEIQGW